MNSLFLHLLPKFQTIITTLISYSSHKGAEEVKAQKLQSGLTLPAAHTLMVSQKHYFLVTKMGLGLVGFFNVVKN